jgi:hypothetical protein
MRHRYGLALLLLLAPAVAQAQDAPERLLPATTQFYVRWDGIDAHRASYAKTALGQMMQGDTGTFLSGIFEQLQGGAGSLLTVESLLRGENPQKLQKMQADAKSAATLLPLLGKNGFILAGEVRSLEPPSGQVTLILPGMGQKPEPLFGALRLSAGLAKVEIKETKVGARTVYSLDLTPAYLAWWVEGKHAVVAVGTDKPDVMVKNMSDPKRAPLSDNPLYKRLAGFDKFETSARAFVDVAAFVKLGSQRNKDVAKLLDDLGLTGLRSLVLYSGFEGRAERGLVEWDMPGPRKGLLKLVEGKPFTLADVPALPPDVVSWTVTNFDIAGFYDTAYMAAEQIVRIFSPDDVGKVKEYTKQANDFLGIDIRKDLLGSLGDRFAYYTSPGDGPFTLGQTILIKVKDADKLQTALEQVIKALANAAGKEVRIKKRTYRGVTVREVYVQQQGFIIVPTYTVHKDWLVLGFYPQPVHGFIQRSKGDLPAWKPSPVVQESLGQLPKEFISISYSDPRPSLTQLMSLAPLIAGTVASLSPELNFDVGSLPNTQDVVRHLFPNVSVTTDDGKTLRQESRDSLALPFDVTGLDTYSLFILFSFSRAAFGIFGV